MLSSGGVVRSSILPFRGSDRGFKFSQGITHESKKELEELKIPPGASISFTQAEDRDKLPSDFRSYSFVDILAQHPIDEMLEY